jgi:hypothetical protein
MVYGGLILILVCKNLFLQKKKIIIYEEQQKQLIKKVNKMP